MIEIQSNTLPFWSSLYSNQVLVMDMYIYNIEYCSGTKKAAPSKIYGKGRVLLLCTYFVNPWADWKNYSYWKEPFDGVRLKGFQML